MKLKDLIDLNELQSIQDCFAEVTNFAAITVDFQGKPILKYSCFSNFCSKLREDPYYNDLCMRSDAHGSLEAVRKNDVYIYKCHAGLIDFAIPIIVDGEYIASMMCGQVIAADDDETVDKFINPSKNIFKKHPHLNDYYENIPVLPFNKIKQTANLLFFTLNQIVKQHLANTKNIELLELLSHKQDIENQFKQLELKHYNSQINPHFLFNALNTAGRLAYLEKASKTQDIIYAITHMYRNILNNTGSLITVQEEIKNINNYIYIQKIRFGELLKFSIHIDELIYNYKIPFFAIQTFVENAIKHGLEPKEDLGSVTIVGSVSKNTLKFEIDNDGVSISNNNLILINQRSYDVMADSKLFGLGIYNICKRLDYFYEKDYTLHFQNNSIGGTKVTLQIPLARVQGV